MVFEGILVGIWYALEFCRGLKVFLNSGMSKFSVPFVDLIFDFRVIRSFSVLRLVQND